MAVLVAAEEKLWESDAAFEQKNPESTLENEAIEMAVWAAAAYRACSYDQLGTDGVSLFHQ